jgi:hypothetical protein
MEEIQEKILELSDISKKYVHSEIISKGIVTLDQVSKVLYDLEKKQGKCTHTLKCTMRYGNIVECVLCGKKYECQPYWYRTILESNNWTYDRDLKIEKCESCDNTVEITVCSVCKKSTCSC